MKAYVVYENMSARSANLTGVSGRFTPGMEPLFDCTTHWD